jgi:hypothetical protein
MRKLLAIMSLLILIPSAMAGEDEAVKPAETRRVPAHNPEWTNPKGSDPGTSDSVSTDLQKIIVLCATEPQSAEFRKQWSAYVRRNYVPGTDIDAIIADVIKRADAYRTKQRPRSGNAPARAVQPNEKTEKMMHDTAKAIIRNMKA